MELIYTLKGMHFLFLKMLFIEFLFIHMPKRISMKKIFTLKNRGHYFGVSRNSNMF